MELKYTQSALLGEKLLLRKRILSQRKALSERQVAARGDKIFQNLFKIPFIVSKKKFLIYLPVNNEVDTTSIIKNLIRIKVDVFLPAFLSKKLGYAVSKFDDFESLVAGPMQILQPKRIEIVDIGFLDAAIIPGVAFDRRGVRLGYGKGVYDKLLKSFKGLKIGLAYDFQIVNELPKEEHDVTVDIVLGENLLINKAT